MEGAAAAARQARETVATLSSDDGQFAVACRETDRRPAPVVHLIDRGELLDDEFVSRQLHSKL